jgi:hypothetical protein
MFSFITKLENFFPLKTKNVKPTKEGKITDPFEVILIGTFVLPNFRNWFISSKTLLSIKGPFQMDLIITVF